MSVKELGIKTEDKTCLLGGAMHAVLNFRFLLNSTKKKIYKLVFSCLLHIFFFNCGFFFSFLPP